MLDFALRTCSAVLIISLIQRYFVMISFWSFKMHESAMNWSFRWFLHIDLRLGNRTGSVLNFE